MVYMFSKYFEVVLFVKSQTHEPTNVGQHVLSQQRWMTEVSCVHKCFQQCWRFTGSYRNHCCSNVLYCYPI